MAKTDKISLAARCIHGHDFILTRNARLKLKGDRSGFSVICPTCEGVAPVKIRALAKLWGLPETATAEDVVAVTGLEAEGGMRGDPIAENAEPVKDMEETEQSSEDPEASYPGEESYGNEGGEVVTGEEVIPPEAVEVPVEAPVKRVISSRTGQRPQGVMRPARTIDLSVPEDPQEYIPSGQEIFLEIVRQAKLPADQERLLNNWIPVEPEWEEPMKVRATLGRAGVPSAKADQLAKIFETTLDMHKLRAERSQGMASLIAGDIGRRGYQQQNSVQRYAPGYGSKPASSTGGQEDLETLAINAVIERSGGKVTPEVLQQMDEIRTMFAMRRGEVSPTAAAAGPGFVPMPAVSPAGIQQMILDSQTKTLDAVRQIMSEKAQKEQADAREVERRAAEDKRYNDMMQMMQMMIASKNSAPVPVQPAESPEKTMLMELLKDQLAASKQPQQDLMQHPMFMRLFEHMLEESKGKPSEVTQGIFSELQSLKEQMGRMGGGPGGLPSNPDQLRAYVEYMKVVGDLDKTKSEFADRAETKKLIETVATTGLKAIGEAMAATFVMNPGTPQAKSVEVQETPVDDGSIIKFMCPGCGVPIHAPAEARAVKCPQCGAIMDRAGSQMTDEQLAELQERVMAEQNASEGGAMSEEESHIPPLTVQQQLPKKEAPHELGPVSRQMQKKPEASLPEQSANFEESVYESAGEESNLSSVEQLPTQGG